MSAAWVLLLALYGCGVGVGVFAAIDNGDRNSWQGVLLTVVFWPLWGAVILIALPLGLLQRAIGRPRMFTTGGEQGHARFHGLIREGWRPARFVGILWRSYTVGVMRWSHDTEQVPRP